MCQRLDEFSLSLHPDKTRLIEFGRHAADRRARAGLGKPETFKFLGFVFICGRSRKGKFQLKRRAALARALAAGLARVEGGKGNPTFNMLGKIAEATEHELVITFMRKAPTEGGGLG
jgi:hypothetical protein